MLVLHFTVHVKVRQPSVTEFHINYDLTHSCILADLLATACSEYVELATSLIS